MNYLIAGLGNIGDEYAHTRHNIGFDILDVLAAKHDVKFCPGRLADYSFFKFKGRQFHLIKPTTYMNLSGKAIRYWLNDLKIEQQNLLVTLDDLALPLGVLRMKSKGSDAGHNGLKNIDLELAGNNYPRLRFGISNNFPKGKQVNFVLGRFSKEEELLIKPKIEKACDMILAFATIGIDRTMNSMNE